MPRDTATLGDVAQVALAPERETVPDLSKPSLEGLAWLLERPMPEGFRWDFRVALDYCGTVGCALGLAQIIWPRMPWSSKKRQSDNAAAAFGIPEPKAYQLFIDGRGTYRRSMEDVRPAMVAKVIRHYIATGHAEYIP